MLKIKNHSNQESRVDLAPLLFVLSVGWYRVTRVRDVCTVGLGYLKPYSSKALLKG